MCDLECVGVSLITIFGIVSWFSHSAESKELYSHCQLAQQTLWVLRHPVVWFQRFPRHLDLHLLACCHCDILIRPLRPVHSTFLFERDDMHANSQSYRTMFAFFAGIPWSFGWIALSVWSPRFGSQLLGLCTLITACLSWQMIQRNWQNMIVCLEWRAKSALLCSWYWDWCM